MDMNNLKSQWDRVAAVGLTALGGIILLVGWIGVSGSAYLAEQAPYLISGGVGGVFFLGIGATLWISADLRDEWRKLDRIEQALGDGTLRWAEEFADAGGRSGHSGPTLNDELWSGSATTPTRTPANGSSARKSTASVRNVAADTAPVDTAPVDALAVARSPKAPAKAANRTVATRAPSTRRVGAVTTVPKATGSSGSRVATPVTRKAPVRSRAGAPHEA